MNFEVFIYLVIKKSITFERKHNEMIYVTNPFNATINRK
jgi:hypothetical protein